MKFHAPLPGQGTARLQQDEVPSAKSTYMFNTDQQIRLDGLMQACPHLSPGGEGQGRPSVGRAMERAAHKMDRRGHGPRGLGLGGYLVHEG